MTPNNIISKLRNATTKVIHLDKLTAALRATGDIGPDDVVRVQIRKVTAAEVVAETGATPLMFSLSLEGKKGVSREELQERLSERVMTDPEALRDLQVQVLSNQRAVVTLGVTAISIDPAGTRPDWQPLQLEATGEVRFDLLGDDFETVHDAIVDFGSMPYGRFGGSKTEAFPEQPARVGSEQGSRELRPDAEPVPRPPAG